MIWTFPRQSTCSTAQGKNQSSASGKSLQPIYIRTGIRDEASCYFLRVEKHLEEDQLEKCFDNLLFIGELWFSTILPKYIFIRLSGKLYSSAEGLDNFL